MAILGFDHVGIRVAERERSVRFYSQLGFTGLQVDADGDLELLHPCGLRINLICNADPKMPTHNILLDETTRHAGITHVAFVVADLASLIRSLRRWSIAITEGPKHAPRRSYLFIRDPDGNVLEFNQLHPG